MKNYSIKFLLSTIFLLLLVSCQTNTSEPPRILPTLMPTAVVPITIDLGKTPVPDTADQVQVNPVLTDDSSMTFGGFMRELPSVMVYIFFFPIICPLIMIIFGTFIGIFVPGAEWAVKGGLYLLTQRWWWFPVGWISGAILMAAVVISTLG